MPQDPDEIGALWQKTSARGDYMAGTVNGSEKHPDWRVLKSKPKGDKPEPEQEAW